MSNRPGQAKNRGFTLLELGIVLGVSAILAAAIVPDLIETMRNKMGERAAADVAIIHDAARLFYIQNQNISALRWPGENSQGQCAAGGWTPANTIKDLILGGYIASGSGGLAAPAAFRNPWGQSYEPNLYATGVGGGPICMFGI